MSIDTLTVVRRLEAAGTPRDQAEALAEVLRDAESRSLAELATKADLALLEQRLDARVDQLEQRLQSRVDQLEQRFGAQVDQLEQRFDGKLEKLDGRFGDLEQRMTIKLGGMMVVAVGAVAALVRLL